MNKNTSTLITVLKYLDFNISVKFRENYISFDTIILAFDATFTIIPALLFGFHINAEEMSYLICKAH